MIRGERRCHRRHLHCILQEKLTGETDGHLEADLICPTGAGISGARQQRAAEVDAIAVPWIAVGVEKRNLKEELGVLIPNVE